MAGIDANTLVMLHLDNSFVDASTNNFTVTNNNVTFANTTPNFGGTYYGVWDVGTDYITIPNNSVFNFGTGNYTFEWWIYLDSAPSSGNVFDLITYFGNVGANGFYSEYLNSAGTMQWSFVVFSSSTPTVNYTINTTITLSTWTHMAIVRNGVTTSLYKAGTSVGSVTSGTMGNNTNQPMIFANYNNHNTGVIGKLQEIRISNIARWTADFTPPTNPYSVATSPILRANSRIWGV